MVTRLKKAAEACAPPAVGGSAAQRHQGQAASGRRFASLDASARRCRRARIREGRTFPHAVGRSVKPTNRGIDPHED